MTRLFLRLSTGILLALVISVLVAGYLQYVTHIRDIEERISPPHHTITMLLMDRFAPLSPEDWPGEVDYLRDRINLDIELVDREDEMIPEEAREELATGKPFFFSDRRLTILPLADGNQLLILGFFRPKPPPQTSMETGSFKTAPRRPDPPFDRLPFPPIPLPLTLSAIIIIVATTGFLLAYPVAKKLKQLEHAAVRISSGDLTARAGLTSSDAIGSLAQRFDQMADKTQALLESQRHLLQAVAHELRTPIARIAFSLEMLSEARDEAERDKRTEQMEEDLTELNQLVDELLLFTRFDAVDETLEKEQIQLPEVLLETIARIGATRPQIDIVVPAVTEEGLAIVAHHVYLKRAFQNLLTNAVRHAHQKVEVRFGSTDGGTCIEVLDDGPGIPQEAREAILEPFSRLDESRSRESGGVGLGLAIVRRIMAAHNGGVRIDDSPLGGAQFSLDFPN